MFPQTCIAAWLVLATLGSFTLATAQEPKVKVGTNQITNSIGMKLTLIPSGEFMMGSKESAEETATFFNKNYGMKLTAVFFENEHPQHRVRITKPFYLGTYQVTRGQFHQFVKDSGYKTEREKIRAPGADGWDAKRKAFVPGYNDLCWRNVVVVGTGGDAVFEQTDEHPVVNVTWNDAMAFCRWLSQKESKTYQLPTEAQWEYACRAGTKTRYYSGDDPESLAKVGNVGDAVLSKAMPGSRLYMFFIKASDGYVFSAPVGQFKPNAFGLYDMHGNAWEWCLDWYDEDYYGKSPVDDPPGPNSGKLRVLRGASWAARPQSPRSADRGARKPDDAGEIPVNGFRVVRTSP